MLKPGNAALDDEGRDPLVALRAVDGGEDEEVVGGVGQADPDLAAVEDVPIAVAAAVVARLAASEPTPGSVRPKVASLLPRACGTR